MEGMEPQAKRPRLCAAGEVAWSDAPCSSMRPTCAFEDPAAAPPHAAAPTPRACDPGLGDHAECTGGDGDAAAPSGRPPRDESLVVFVKVGVEEDRFSGSATVMRRHSRLHLLLLGPARAQVHVCVRPTVLLILLLASRRIFSCVLCLKHALPMVNSRGLRPSATEARFRV
jgi:hypothetical protein